MSHSPEWQGYGADNKTSKNTSKYTSKMIDFSYNGAYTIGKEAMKMINLTSAINYTIPISQFHKGMAAQIFSDVRKCGAKVVIKNNEPECVLMSPTEYMGFMDELADTRLELLALKRIAGGALEHISSQKEVMDSLGISDEDLAEMEEVEIE